MKLRIQGNSLRLRLTQPEVRHFEATGRVEDAIRFGPAPGTALTYVLERNSAAEVSVRFEACCIIVLVPESIAAAWTATEEVGFEAVMPITGSAPLRILVEKRFSMPDGKGGRG